MRLYRRAILGAVSLGSFFLVTSFTFLRRDSGSSQHEVPKDLHLPVTISQGVDLTAESGEQCSYNSSCRAPRILIRIHAETANAPPYGCLNDVKLFDEQHLKKGFNLVSLNGSSGEIESTIYADVTASDGMLINWLRSLQPSSVIIGVSFGDVAERVSADARAALASFGASKIADWRGTSSYAILGQRGLQQTAHELVVLQSAENAVRLIEGCFELPLGEVKDVVDKLPDIQRPTMKSARRCRLKIVLIRREQGKINQNLSNVIIHVGMKDDEWSFDQDEDEDFQGTSSQQGSFRFGDGRCRRRKIDPEKMAALSGVSRTVDQNVQLGSKWKWCGMSSPCSADEIPMYFFSGEHKDDWPRLCIGERMVFDRGLNGAGRGLNLVSVEPKTGRVSAAAHFDTYGEESSDLEKWLENIPLGEVMAVISFDEASNMLSDMAKRIFYEMGSSMIYRLKFRASWYFIGHKRLAAYSPFEDLNIPSGNNWAKPIKTSLCLPKKLDTWRGRKTSSTMGVARPLNLPRRHFCLKHDRHGKFCSEKNIDDPIRPKALLDVSRVGDPVFNMPIVVAAGLSTDSLRICLESLMDQEGLNTQMIIVAYDKEYPENAELASLFHVKSIPVNASAGYNSLIVSSLSAAFSVFTSASSVAVIEEDVRLSNDWLYYISQVLPVFLDDETIDIVQTFNPNGFANRSGDESLVYRIDFQPPLYSYIIKREKYEKEIKYSADCCTRPGRWMLKSSKSLVPDVSRITVAHSGLGNEKWSNALFFYDRCASEGKAVLVDDFRTETSYDNSIASLIAAAPRIRLEKIDCNAWKQQIVETSQQTNASSIIITCGSDISELAVASRCFGLYFDQRFVTGVYKRVIRFVSSAINVFIIPEMLLTQPVPYFVKHSLNITEN